MIGPTVAGGHPEVRAGAEAARVFTEFSYQTRKLGAAHGAWWRRPSSWRAKIRALW